MLKKGPHPIDRAIWGTFDGAGTHPPAAPKAKAEADSGQIDLRALIAEAEAEMAAKRGEQEAATPAIGAHPLSVFPFDPPAAPAPSAAEDVIPSFHRTNPRSLIVPGALIVIAGALTVMAVRSDTKTMPVACAVSVDLPATAAPPPPPSAVEARSEEVKPPPSPPTAAPSSRPPARRRPAPPLATAAPVAPETASAPPEAPPPPPQTPEDPCKGDLLCAMKRATERR